MKKILIVDDEPPTVILLTFNLKKEDYKITSAADGSEELELALEQSLDFIILDAILPTMGGMEITQRPRQEKNETLILVLTTKDDQADRITGLGIGTDDYLTKLFNPRKVLARMKTIFRRIEPRKQSKDEAEPGYLSVRQITADLTNYQITIGDRLIELTPKEFELLVYFMKRRSHVIDRDTLLDRIQNFNFAGQSRIVDVHVSHLREEVERNPKHPKYLAIVRGFGYKFQKPKR